MSVEPLDSTVFVNHSAQDVSLVASLVDFLEEAVPELEGHIVCSTLPGYTRPGADLAQHALVVVLHGPATDAAAVDGVRRAQHRGTPVAVLCRNPGERLDGPLAAALRLEMDRGGLSTLVEDAAFAVGALPRLSVAVRDQLADLIASVRAERDAEADRARAAVLREAPCWEDTSSTDALRSDDSLPELRAAIRSRRQSQPVPRPPNVGANRCAEVGISLSECLFHDLPLSALDATSRARMDELYVGLGGTRLSAVAPLDAERYQRGLDEVLEALPPERRYLAHWFEAGFQLALACNLGLCAADRSMSAELASARNEAWTAFAVAASELRVGQAQVSAIAAQLAQLLEVPARHAEHRATALQLLSDVARQYDAQRAEARRQRQQAQA